MSIFDQRNQHVKKQKNDVINSSVVQNKIDLIVELEKISVEIKKAAKRKAVGNEAARGAEAKIKKAISQTKRKKPNKKTVVEYLDEAKALLESFTSATGLITAIAQATELVKKVFL